MAMRWQREGRDGAREWWVRLFPQAMQRLCPDFVAQNCSYRMHKSKASTMRIVMYSEHGVHNAYTLETSLAGARGRHFTRRCAGGG
jgi:hypothetical protein